MSYNYQGVAASSTDHLPGPGPIGDKPPGPYGYGFAPDAVRSSGGGIAKWKIIAGVVGVLAIIGIAVGVGVGVSMSKKNSGSSSSSGSSSGSSNVNMDDPSKFDKDSKLHLSLYGLAYTPENSLLPNCGNKLEDVIRDVQLISQLTTRIRLYGADCNQSALVLEAIQRTKVNLNVYLGNYVVPEDADAVYNRQKTAIQQAIQTYGTDHIAGITVGNEFMLNYLNANGATDPDSTVGNAGAAILTKFISDTRTMLSGMSLTKTIPVGTSDAGSFFNTQVLSAVDYGLSNVHPWFANTTIDNAAGWTYSFFQDTNVAKAQSLTNKPEMYIAETGWPSKSSDAGNANNGASDASVANLQKFIDTFVCQANTNGTKYFYFEYSDEPWKDKQFGGVEGWWGLFNSDRTLKALTIPDCAAP